MRRMAAVSVLSVALFGILISCSKPNSDDVIVKDIQTKVVAEPEAKDAEVSVVAQSGKVTLRGRVPSKAAQGKVEKIAQEEPGVTAVDDQTSIGTSEAAAVTVPPVPTAPPPPPPPPKPIVVPAGTVLTVRLGQQLGSKVSQTGAMFSASMANPITIGGKVAIPDGSDASGSVTEAKKAGRMKGGAVLRLTLNSVTVKGHKYNIEADAISQESTGKGKRTAAMTVGGAGAGAAIGGLAGGGKGAGIGALVGVTAGAIGAGTTGNRDIALPAESALSFKLRKPLTLKPDSRQ
jgi:hypothetical protein